MVDYISSHAKHLVPNEFRAQLASSDSANLVLDNVEVFRFIFDRYANSKSRTIDRNTFLKLMYDIDMMVPVEEKGNRGRKIELLNQADQGALTIDQVDQLLDLVYGEAAKNVEKTNKDGGSALNTERTENSQDDGEETVGLVFVSFIEAVCRAGNERWQYEADDLDHRIETTIQQLRRLQFEKTNRRYLPQGDVSSFKTTRNGTR